MNGRVQQLVTKLAAVSVLAASLVAGTASVASAAGCSATNTGTGVRFGSLQSAVTAAAPGDTLRISGTCTGNVTIAKRLTLVGTGTGPTLRGNGGRPLTIVGGPVTIDRLRITDGVATSCGGAAIQRDACGGGILASVKVTIKRSVVDGNLVSAVGDASGGGIAVTNGATLRVSDSTIRDNVLTADAVAGDARGGGIFADGPVTVTRSRIDGNVAGGFHASGGGLAGDAAVTLTQSVVIDNKALGGTQAEGGGISGTEVARIDRSTIARNKAIASNALVSIASGGGLRVPQAAISNSTFSGNTVQALGVAVGGASGGGLSFDEGSIVASTVAGNSATSGGGVQLGNLAEMGSTIVAGNRASFVGPDCVTLPGTATLGRNLVGNDAGCGGVFVHAVAGDKVGTGAAPIAAKLAALAANGGPTQTRALKPGSPAIDGAGAKPCSTTTDQRGVRRPQRAKCDIGAFERS